MLMSDPGKITRIENLNDNLDILRDHVTDLKADKMYLADEVAHALGRLENSRKHIQTQEEIIKVLRADLSRQDGHMKDMGTELYQVYEEYGHLMEGEHHDQYQKWIAFRDVSLDYTHHPLR